LWPDPVKKGLARVLDEAISLEAGSTPRPHGLTHPKHLGQDGGTFILGIVRGSTAGVSSAFRLASRVRWQR
jgi:hypothetical protein